jgi:uncharacterized protein (DUF1800 family)
VADIDFRFARSFDLSHSKSSELMPIKSNQIAAWKPYESSDATPWNRERVVHLHRRAAFAASWREIKRDLVEGPNASVDRLLSGNARTYAAPPDFETMARTIGDAAQASNDDDRLKAWWFYRMLFSPDPLRERLTLLWHCHFATSNRKVQELGYMREQNDLFRQHALAPFGELLAAVVKHPAMLVWLDADSNRAGHANENLARELMELFTLGIGNYSEADVQAAARALTGCSVSGKAYRFVSARHDDGEVDLLGRRGKLDGDELLALLVEHPATAKRLAWRLCTMFFGEGVVSDTTLDSLAAELHQRKLDIGWGVETILRSQLFYSQENIRTRITGPVEFIVGSLHALELQKPPPSTVLLTEWATRMGQDLFYPPNVGGWKEGRSWLSSRAVIARANFAGALVAGGLWSAGRKPELLQLAERYAKSANLEETVEWLAELTFGGPSPAATGAALTAAKEKKESDKLATAVAVLLSHPEAQLA